jgi:hypothetical protein
VLYGNLRSRLPLRGSPGFTPGSLLIPPDKKLSGEHRWQLLQLLTAPGDVNNDMRPPRVYGFGSRPRAGATGHRRRTSDRTRVSVRGPAWHWGCCCRDRCCRCPVRRSAARERYHEQDDSRGLYELAAGRHVILLAVPKQASFGRYARLHRECTREPPLSASPNTKWSQMPFTISEFRISTDAVANSNKVERPVSQRLRKSYRTAIEGLRIEVSIAWQRGR